jgi:hypothetical protein
MKIRRILLAALCAAVLLSSTSCIRAMVGNRTSSEPDTSSEESVDSYSYPDYSVSSESAAETKYGNETVGWMTLDETFFQWYTPGNSSTCVQYAKSPYEILTMDVIECAPIKEQTGVDFDAQVAASSRVYQLQEEASSQNIEKITGAREALGRYDAYQVYCYYPDDDQYLVMWYMDSPDKTVVYYVAAEFRSSEMAFFNFAQTYQMPGN